jgi:hypothetical protein
MPTTGGSGGKGIRYKTFSSPKNRSGSGDVDAAGTFPKARVLYLVGVLTAWLRGGGKSNLLCDRSFKGVLYRVP